MSPAEPDSTDREIHSTRVFAAPRELVWRAWTEPEPLARWWGPAGFTNTFREFDARPGGDWRFTMHGPDGTNYDNHSVFVELAAPERIVFDHLSAPKFRITATFTEEAGGTRVDFLMCFETAAICAAVRPVCVPSNEQNFDRLAAELQRLRPQPQAPFMLLFRNAGPESHAHLTAEQKSAMAKQWNDWVERLVARGQMQHGHPLGLGGRVVSGPTGARVTDGPYAEAKEAVGGYFFLTVADIDEAIAIAQQCPGLPLGLTVEVRPVAAFSPVLDEVRARPPST